MLVENQRQINFKSLVNPHMHALKMTAMRLAKNETDAEDILQETLYKAFRSMDQFEQNTNFKAWIFRILVNTYITSYRKAVRQPHRVSISEQDGSYPIPGMNTCDETEQADAFIEQHFSDEVLTALNKLPNHFKVVIMLCDIQGFSYNEISDMVDIPVGTVMSRLHRGRKILQRFLWGYAKEKGLASGPKPAL